MVGLIRSRMPANICLGSVRVSGDEMNRATTSSSNEVAKANSAPETTPGAISGRITLRKAVSGGAPRLAAARASDQSKPVSVEITVTTTKGVARIVWAITSPSIVP